MSSPSLFAVNGSLFFCMPHYSVHWALFCFIVVMLMHVPNPLLRWIDFLVNVLMILLLILVAKSQHPLQELIWLMIEGIGILKHYFLMLSKFMLYH